MASITTAWHGLDLAAARAVLQKAIADGAFPGAAWGVLLDGDIIACEGAGRFTYDADAPPVSSETMYDLASLTKVVATTSIAMLLWQRSALDLDAPLGGWFPEFAAGESSAARGRVTLRMLLAHSSGLPAHVPLWEQVPLESTRPEEDALALCMRVPLESPPGTATEYSDIGFILLGAVLEKISGMPLETMFAEWVADPLRLRDTCFGPLTAERAARAAPTRDPHWRRVVLRGEVHDENCAVLGGVAGHAGLFSTAPDVLRFADAILRPPQDGVFEPRTVREFTTRQTEPAGTSRTLGWDTPTQPSQSGRCFGPRTIGHLGYAGTSLWLDLDRRLAVTLLTNRVFTVDAGEPPRAIVEVRPAFHDALLNC